MKYAFKLIAAASLLFLAFVPASKKELSVISYNVWNGFESETTRRNTFVQWAQQQNADVIAFAELNHFTQASFTELAKTWGHPYAIILKESGYPVGISSRYPIKNAYKLITGMHHGCLYAEIEDISFFVVHFSPVSSTKRLQEADSVIHAFQVKSKLKRKIILGDFNAFSPGDSIFYVGTSIKDSMYSAEKQNSKLRNLNDRGEIDYQVIGSFLRAGFYDGFSLFHKNFEASYPTKVFGTVPISSQIKIDHVLLSNELKKSCKKVELIKDNITDTLSDHYPIRAVFDRWK